MTKWLQWLRGLFGSNNTRTVECKKFSSIVDEFIADMEKQAQRARERARHDNQKDVHERATVRGTDPQRRSQ